MQSKIAETVAITSSPFACGITLLTNALFSLEPDFKFLWEHRLTFGKTAPVVVVIRDPRDAIFSMYRRWVKSQDISISYHEFLKRASSWPDHFPGLFYLNPIKTFMMFYLLWAKQSNYRPVRFVKFEDLKGKNGIDELMSCFEFLGRSFDKEKVKESVTQTASSGVPFEWQLHYSATDYSFFSDSSTKELLSCFGYEKQFQAAGTYNGIVDKSADTASRRVMWWVINLFSRKVFKLSKRIYVSRLWAERVGLFPAPKWKLQNFFYNIIPILITEAELDFIIKNEWRWT